MIIHFVRLKPVMVIVNLPNKEAAVKIDTAASQPKEILKTLSCISKGYEETLQFVSLIINLPKREGLRGCSGGPWVPVSVKHR
jgi:hypothetical protein